MKGWRLTIQCCERLCTVGLRCQEILQELGV